MDLSYWNNLSLDIVTEPTSKQFYGKFVWRLVLHAAGGRLIDTSKDLPIKQALEFRILKYSMSRGWRYRNEHNDLNNASVELLESLRDIKSRYSDKIRVRIEEPNVQIYAEDEQTLKDIVSLLPCTDCIEKVSGPQDSKQEQMLKSGVIFRTKPTDYKYKVIFRDGRYDPAAKLQILNYINSVGPGMAKITPGAVEMLNNNYSYIWGVYFYTNDPSIVTFISLIEPSIISKIHELVTVD